MGIKIDNPASIAMLLVEDDEVILKLQTTILAVKFPGITLYTAANGRLGLELFRAHTPDIVITDINMAEMCGVQMAANIRAIRPKTIIIAITGKSCEASVTGKYLLQSSTGAMVEFDHVIVKPVDLSELYGIIEQSIGDIANI